MIDGGGDGRRLAGRVARDHAGRAVFAERAGEGQHCAGQHALPAAGHPNTPENVGVGEPERLAGVGQRLVKGLKGSAHRAVHQREDDDRGGEDGRPPGHDQLDAEGLEHPCADDALGPQYAQQQIAHDRRRQHERQREHHIQHALDEPREFGDIVRGKDAGEEDDDGGDRRDAQRVP